VNVWDLTSDPKTKKAPDEMPGGSSYGTGVTCTEMMDREVFTRSEEGENMVSLPALLDRSDQTGSFPHREGRRNA